MSCILACAAIIGMGCARETGSIPDSTGASPAGSDSASDWQATLLPVTFDEWQLELASMQGRIVVVDLWATWCLPCIERFPHMIDLARRYRDQGVTFVSLCLDDRDDAEALASAQRFLTEQGARFPNFLMDEVVTHAFDKLDLLGIPAVFIYGPSGELRFRLTGDDPNNQFTDADVDNAIESLLATL